MSILYEQIAKRVKGPMAENEDWWHLCYDTEAREFFVEHEWSYVRINGLDVDSGKSRHDADKWHGEGAENISNARRCLLERAVP